jgi:RND superfamily putative drug exporter
MVTPMPVSFLPREGSSRVGSGQEGKKRVLKLEGVGWLARPDTFTAVETLLARLAVAAGRRRAWFIAAWVVLLVVAGPFAGQTQKKLSNGGFEVPGSQSQAIVDYFDRLPGSGAQPITILVRMPSASATSARLRQVIQDSQVREPSLHFFLAPVASRDGRTMAAFGYSSLNQNRALDLAGRLEKSYQRETPSQTLYILGPAATYHLFQKITTHDLELAEGITAPVIVLVLLALFGAVVAATVPLMLGVISVAITTGLMYFIAVQTEISIYATTMISMIGIGVAVDYSLFVVARFREELGAGATKEEAVTTAMRTSGTAVVFSGVTVILSLLSIWVVPVRAVQSMAAGAIMVVAVAILAAATFLPAILHALGRRVDRLRIPGVGGVDTPSEHAFWSRWASAIMRRPLLAFAGAALLLGALALPALSLETDNRALEQLGRGTAINKGNALLVREITGPGQGRESAVSVLVRPRGGDLTALLPGAQALARQVAGVPHILDATVERRGDAWSIIAPMDVDPEGSVAKEQVVREVRRLAAASPLQGPARVDVGGVSAFNLDLNDEVGGDLWKVMVLVVALAYVVLLVLLRSVLLPLKAVLMNILSIGAAYGVLVMIFQWGWLDWTGYHHLGHLNTLNPSLILAITFGLSMDYEVFLLSRIKERYELHGSNERAVAEGIASSARLITSAAAIMVVVFGGFALTGVPAIKEIGVGLAVAIAIDASITRLVLVPATMRLLGDWNWWLPGWLNRVIPRIAHETSRPQPVEA